MPELQDGINVKGEIGRPIPEDKNTIRMLNMIVSNYKSKGVDVRIRRASKDVRSCDYIIKIGSEEKRVKKKRDLEELLKDSYSFDKVRDQVTLKQYIEMLIQNHQTFVNIHDEDRINMLNQVFPDLGKLVANIQRLKELERENEFYEGIDFEDIDFSEMLRRSASLVERAEEENENNTLLWEIEKQRYLDEIEAKRRAKEDEQDIKDKSKAEEQKRFLRIGQKKGKVEGTIAKIPNSLEVIYYKMKQEEEKFCGLAKALGLTFAITRTDTLAKEEQRVLQGNVIEL